MEKSFSPAFAWSFLDNLNEGVIIVGADGAIHHVNRMACQMLGTSGDEFSLADLLPETEGLFDLPPGQTAVLTLDNGRTLTLESKAIDGEDDLYQLLLMPKASDTAVHQITTLTRISSEPDFDKKLQRIVDGLQANGWDRALLSLRDDQFNPTQLITAGFTPDELDDLRQNLLPAAAWETLFTEESLQVYRHGGCYFVPGDSDWSQKNMRALDGNALPSVSDNQAWRQRDLVCAPLYGRRQQRIGLIGLDKPRNGRRPDTATLQTIELYAQFAASVIENSQLAAETLMRNREIETLLAANQAISGILEPEAILALTSEHMLAAVQADGVAIFEWREDDNLIALHDVARQSDGPTLAKGSSIPLPENGAAMAVLNQNKPVTTAVIQADEAPLPVPPWLPEGTPYTVALVPLVLADEQSFGLIQIVRANLKGIGDHEMELLGALASQAGTALDNAFIFEETYERERFYNALGAVSLAINYTLDRDTVLDLIASESARMFSVDGAYIWLIEDNQLVGRAAFGENCEAFMGRVVPLSDEAAFVSQVYQGGMAFYHNHVSQNENVSLRLPAETAAQAILGVPIEQEGKIIAILILADTQNPNRFSYKEVAQATTFGVQVAIALRNAQLFEELHRFNEELDTRVADRTRELHEESNRVKILLRITSDLSASLDQDRVLSQALQLVNEIINAVQGAIFLIDPETDELIFRATLGMDMKLPREGLPSGMKRGDGLAGWMIDNRSPVVVSDTHDDPRWVHRAASAEHRSVLGVPLITNEEVIGVLMLFHTEPNAFTMQQADLVEAAAIQVASAINNANLYLLIRDQAERLGSMLRAEQIEAAKSQSILESIADGVLVADENNRVILTNAAASNILDVPRHELVGKPVNELLGLYGRSGESWVSAFAEWGQNADRIEPGTFLADRFEIEDKVVSVHLSPVLSGLQFFGTVSIFRDITKEVEVEKLKSEFVSTVSHELRTPMTSIKGYADLMLMGAVGQLSDPQQRYLKVIKNNADRLHMLVNDLLDISHIETERTTLDIRPVDVTQLVEQVVDGHLRGRIQHAQKQIEVKTELPSTLPLVNADFARVTQVLTNLLDNAFNYTPENGRITIHAHAQGNRVYIAVQDTGIGIAKENMDKIFDRFYRSDHTEVQKVSGTGLGLAIVRSLVEMHGGQLDVESEPGQGSAFTFSLPAVLESSHPA